MKAMYTDAANAPGVHNRHGNPSADLGGTLELGVGSSSPAKGGGGTDDALLSVMNLGASLP